MRCSPFRLALFTDMIGQSVSIQAIAHRAGTANHYTDRILSELRAESELVWLIQVGLLRREVDGQGLTDSFRVTPLGGQLAQQWQSLAEHRNAPSLGDRLLNRLSRLFHLSL